MEKSSFFNSVNGDRKYKAEDFASFFNSLVTNGIFPTPSTNLQVIANNNMTVTIKSGKAWINGYLYINDNDLVLPITVADGVLDRIDRIVIKLDTAGRAINSVVKNGTLSSSPIAQTLQRDADGYELGIADIYVGKGVTAITQANISDLRLNTNYCGIVNSLIQADTTTLLNQYTSKFDNKEIDFENEFTTWFDAVKNQLSTDAAGNLQNQINTHISDYTLQVPFAVATGSANTYTISTPTISALTAGMAVSVKINVDSTGASTLNWDNKGAKGIKKANGTNATNLKANGIYTLRYDGTNFLLQGEGGSGNTIASDLLLGKTASTDAGDVVGTMPNNTTANTPCINISTISGRLYMKPKTGYYDQTGENSWIYRDDANFIAANIISGKSIFGLTGTNTNKRWQSGTLSTLTVPYNQVGDVVTNLPFTPSYVIVHATGKALCGYKISGTFYSNGKAGLDSTYPCVYYLVGNFISIWGSSTGVTLNDITWFAFE